MHVVYIYSINYIILLLSACRSIIVKKVQILNLHVYTLKHKNELYFDYSKSITIKFVVITFKMHVKICIMEKATTCSCCVDSSLTFLLKKNLCPYSITTTNNNYLLIDQL